MRNLKMPKTDFEVLQNLLMRFPSAAAVNRRGRDKTPKQAGELGSPQGPDPERHRRKCRICKHPNRDEIEFDYLRWKSTASIARTYGIADHSSICRHASATGLRERRMETVAFALEPILEQHELVFMRATPSSIISAVRAYSQLNQRGQKIRPKRVTNIYYATEPHPAAAPKPTQPPQAPRRSANRPIQDLEDDPTR
jgi:hypothetical protein